ncbi:TPA: hypothetical protein HA242_07020, partial [Candidatus Woesearchaeota archaeon]|nr:hypothetical protein [Candidatus Woesearchaeota archaeon]
MDYIKIRRNSLEISDSSGKIAEAIMKTYFSTFITGFDEVVAHALKQRIKDVQIELLSDGLVIYKTNTSADVVKQLRFFNNTFVLLKQFPKLEKNPVNEMIRQAIRDSRIMPT